MGVGVTGLAVVGGVDVGVVGVVGGDSVVLHLLEPALSVRSVGKTHACGQLAAELAAFAMGVS